VLQEFKLENPTVGEREVGCSPVIREFEFVFLTVGNPYRNGRRVWISSSEAMIYQWTSLRLGLMVKKDNVLRPYITHCYKSSGKLAHSPCSITSSPLSTAYTHRY
jgi:hypothetical protein